MEENSKIKQFNIGHVRVDEKLQGAKLASFSRRLIAYGIDWVIIAICTQFLFLVIPLGLALLFFRKKLNYSLIKSRRIIKKSVIGISRRLDDNTTITPMLKRKFSRNLVVYLYILLYLPIVGSLLYLAILVVGYISPQDYNVITANAGSFLHLISKPVLDLSDGFGLLMKFFGAFIYFAIFTWRWQGQTPAKKLLKIGVVKLDGTKISLYNSLERASGYTASASIVFLGFLQYFWDRNAQTTHDKIAETIVVELLPENRE